jgi:hypothetical protein
MASASLTAPRNKLRHARKRLSDLDLAVQRYRGQAFQISTSVESLTGQTVWQTHRVAPIPDDIFNLASEVLQPLRSALDYMANSLIVANGNVPEWKCGFPIYLEKDAFDRYSPAIVKGMSASAVGRVAWWQPFRAQQPQLQPLWVLNNLNGLEKHRLPISLKASLDMKSVILAPKPGAPVTGTFSFASTFAGGYRDVREGGEILRVISTEPPMTVEEVDMTPEVVVTLNEADMPLVEVFTEILDFVERVVNDFVAEFNIPTTK